MSASTQQTQKNFKQSLGSTWAENHRNNSLYNVGSEIEDLLFDDEGLPLDNETTEEIFRYLEDEVDADLETEMIDGEKRILGVNVENERFQEHIDFPAEIDTDYHPAQSEMATEVFRNPADMVFRTEHLRNMRDRGLPEGASSHEMGMFPGLSLPVENPKHLKRPKKRYTGLNSRHGEVFGSMGWIGSTQLNTGSPVDGDELETGEFFHEFFNGGDEPSMLDVVPAVDSLFTSDPVLQEGEDELYEMVAEGGRDMVYDLFVSNSPAVLRRNTERWGDLLDEALPTNENYGNIEDLSGIDDHEDYIDMAMERPMILSPEVDGQDITVLDPETHEPLGSLEEEYDMEGAEVMPGLSDIGESTLSFKQFLEDRQYLGEVLIDGEMKPVKVDHTDMDGKSFQNLAGLNEDKEEPGYFTFHNTFVRPDIAPKNNGVVEFRSFSNSDRSYEALLTQKSLMHVYDEVQSLFADHGLTTGNSLDFREDAKRDGLDAELPSGASVREVYQNDLLAVLEQGVRESFSGDQMPYTLEMVLEGVDSYDDFGEYLDSEFDDLRDFAEYTTVSQEAGVRPETELDMDEFEQEYEQFVDWFTDTYRETMEQYLDPEFESDDEWDSRNFDTDSERLLKAFNSGGVDKALETTERNVYAEAR